MSGSTAPSPSVGATPSWVASIWWIGYQLPRLFVQYYVARAIRKIAFRLFLRRGREAQLHSETAREMLRAYHESFLASSSDYLSPEVVDRIDAIVDQFGCREAVRRRKADAESGRIDNPKCSQLSQEHFSREARDQLLAILPDDFLPMFELARKRALVLRSISYHETSPDDPMVEWGDSAYNGHPFHLDGNPKLAKVLIYLTDVDEDSGPFEMIPDSRPSLPEELIRLAYIEKHIPRIGFAAGLRERLPAFFRRGTHLWEEDVVSLTRRYGHPPSRVIGERGTLVFFDGMNMHNGSRNQKRRREVLHFIFK
jgi:hypothetical protein